MAGCCGALNLRPQKTDEHWAKQGGNLFRPVGFLVQCDAMVLDRALPDTLYLATREGVHTSEDGGATWRAINEGLATLNVRTIVQSQTVVVQ